MKVEPGSNAANYYYLSNPGETFYVPSTPGRQDLQRCTRRFADTIHDTRLPRPSTPSRGFERSSSAPPPPPSRTTATTDTPISSKLDDAPDSSRSTPVVSSPSTLGLPNDWVIFPLSNCHFGAKPSYGSSSSERKGFHFGFLHSSHHEHESGGHSSIHSQGIDPKNIDYTKPLAFELSTESATSILNSRPRRSSSADTHSSLPPYPGTPPPLPKAEPNKLHKEPPHGLASKTEKKWRLTGARERSEEKVEHDQFRKPKLHHSRPLPREFSEQELHEIRRRTRHCIRVVTRASIGLTSTVALSSVAPQLLIAAAINAYCLGRGALELHEQLRFLRNNELKVMKKDVVVAVIEGVVVKVAFMAITINHDDFVVLAREVLGTHALAMFEVLQAHPVPGFETLNELFIRPMEHAQMHLGLPTMAERAANMSSVGTAFGEGGWSTIDVSSLLGNIFLVGSVQGVMEQWIDVAYDRLGQAERFIRERLEWKFSRRRRLREEEDIEYQDSAIGPRSTEKGTPSELGHTGDVSKGMTKRSNDIGPVMSGKKETMIPAKNGGLKHGRALG